MMIVPPLIEQWPYYNFPLIQYKNHYFQLLFLHHLQLYFDLLLIYQ